MAVVAVMLVHAGLAPFVAGGRGVQVFFVLSGFLITSLLIAEWFEMGEIDIGRFYLRRLLRLYPALLLVLIVTVGVIPLLTAVPAPTDFGVLSILLYFSNWNWTVTGTPTDLGYLPHMWSLAVEEQFYLVWPAALVLLLSRGNASRDLLIATIGIAALSVIDHVVLAGSPGDPLGFRLLGTDVQAEYLMVGCALAVAVARYPARMRRWLGRLAWPALVVMVALAVPWTFTRLPVGLPAISYLRAAAEFSLFGVASAVVIGYLHFANPRSLPTRIMSFTPLVLLGRISYGVYLWHFPIFVIVKIKAGPSITAFDLLFEFAITFAVAALSFVLLERPMLRVKDRLKAKPMLQPASPVAGVGEAG